MDIFNAFDKDTSMEHVTTYALPIDKKEEVKSFLKSHAISCYLKD